MEREGKRSSIATLLTATGLSSLVRLELLIGENLLELCGLSIAHGLHGSMVTLATIAQLLTFLILLGIEIEKRLLLIFRERAP